VAEGVETLEHGSALLAMGCTLAQGYGIARPMPAAQFMDWCARWRSEQRWLAWAPAAV
jgi:EAL domain-containing protein (putative c-di-GMP-specific phosphodiesterase class I)